MKGTMSDIFISYASEDRERIMPLVQALEDAGWSVFWDRTIPAGGTWRQEIGSEIESCRCMVVTWSTDSIESHWVQEEAEEGKSRDILVPVLIDDVSPPLGFRSIQAANLVEWDSTEPYPPFNRLLKDISNKLGAASDKAAPVRRQRQAEEGTTCNQVDASIFDKWKDLSQDNKVKLIVVILGAVLAVMGYFGKGWFESPDISASDTEASVTQTTSGDSSPTISGTKGDVTITITPKENND